MRKADIELFDSLPFIRCTSISRHSSHEMPLLYLDA
jgi:hypothetical protein